jgi:hypothetical protein
MAPNIPEHDAPQGEKDEPLFITLLAKGHSVRAAARRANIPRNTAARKARRPAFKAKVDQLRDELVRQALGRLVGSQNKTAGTLAELLKASSEKVRLGAARAILDTGMKLKEQVGIVEKLAALQRERDEVRREHAAAQEARPDAGRGAPGADGAGQLDAGSNPAGSGELAGPGGHAPGPVPGESAPLGFFAVPAVLQPPGGEESNGGRLGAEDGVA